MKGAGVDEDEVRVADISIHLLEAIEAGERRRHTIEPHLGSTPVAGD